MSVEAKITIAKNTDLEDSTRHLALEFLLTVAETSPTTARKMGTFCQSVVPIALQMMLELECDTPGELGEVIGQVSKAIIKERKMERLVATGIKKDADAMTLKLFAEEVNLLTHGINLSFLSNAGICTWVLS